MSLGARQTVVGLQEVIARIDKIAERKQRIERAARVLAAKLRRKISAARG